MRVAEIVQEVQRQISGWRTEEVDALMRKDEKAAQRARDKAAVLEALAQKVAPRRRVVDPALVHEPALSVPATAVRLGVSRRTVYYWVKRGYLASKRSVHSPGLMVLVASIERLEREGWAKSA